MNQIIKAVRKKLYTKIHSIIYCFTMSRISTQSDVSDAELGIASELLLRVEQRTHYRFIDECLIDTQKLKVQAKAIEDVIAEIKTVLTKEIDEKDFIIEVINIIFTTLKILISIINLMF